MQQSPRNIKILAFTSFLNDIASDATLRLLPLFLSQVLGASTSVIGLIEGVAESTATLTKLLSGWLSDHLPRRKPLVALGYALSGLSKPFLIIANHWSWILLVRFSDRLGKGIRSAPRDALVADESPPETRGHSFGLTRMMDTLGSIVGLSAALFIIHKTSGTALTRDSFKMVVILASIPAVLAVALVCFGIREARKPHQGTLQISKMDLSALPKSYWRYIAILAFFTLAMSSDAFLILKAAKAQGGVIFMLACMIALNLSSTLIALPAGKLSDKLGRKHLIVAGWFVYAISYAAFGLITPEQPIALLLAFFFYGAFYGLSEGAEKSMVADLVGKGQKRGLAYGIFSFTIGFMNFPASVVFGVLLEKWGEVPTFLSASGVALISCVALAVLVPGSRART